MTCRPSSRLEPLLRAVRRRADDVTDRHVPLLVKIAPDLGDEDVLEVADLALALGLDGIVATNTTITRARPGTRPPSRSRPPAAVDCPAPPVRDRATEVIRLLRGRVGPDLTLIGVGGITTPEDALDRLAAGADLCRPTPASSTRDPGGRPG